jgi:hypothetical protein
MLDVGRRGSAKIITASQCKAVLEKKRGMKFTDTQETNLSEIPLRET